MSRGIHNKGPEWSSSNKTVCLRSSQLRNLLIDFAFHLHYHLWRCKAMVRVYSCLSSTLKFEVFEWIMIIKRQATQLTAHIGVVHNMSNKITLSLIFNKERITNQSYHLHYHKMQFEKLLTSDIQNWINYQFWKNKCITYQSSDEYSLLLVRVFYYYFLILFNK